jgi:lipopolysaccharide biosynthesis regulator YciM
MLAATPTFFPARTYRGEILREQGKLTDAIREQEKVLEQDPTNILALGHLSRTYLDLGDVAKARATLERVKPEDRGNYRVRLFMALVLAREGKRAEALKEMDPEVEKYAGVHSLMNAQAAAFYATLGEKEKALEWLDRAVRNGDERAEWFQHDPLLASIRDEARFKEVLESIAFRRQQPATAK